MITCKVSPAHRHDTTHPGLSGLSRLPTAWCWHRAEPDRPHHPEKGRRAAQTRCELDVQVRPLYRIHIRRDRRPSVAGVISAADTVATRGRCRPVTGRGAATGSAAVPGGRSATRQEARCRPRRCDPDRTCRASVAIPLSGSGMNETPSSPPSGLPTPRPEPHYVRAMRVGLRHEIEAQRAANTLWRRSGH